MASILPGKDARLMSDPGTVPVGLSTPQDHVFFAGDTIADRYRVIRFIAKGGMGEVYEVYDQELKTNVALKTIASSRVASDRIISRFRQEIQLARRVTHPNVCRVYDLGHHLHPAHGDILFLTMELLDGQTLSACIYEKGPMSCAQALPILRQMVAALAAAHHLGIVHRDFKPANVMLLPSADGPVVKVTDFGLATTPESEETVSQSVEVMGTPEYMAPEQFRGLCSNRTDVYGLGITAFQMVTGKLPASFDTPFKELPTGTTGTRQISLQWRGAITKSLARDPAGRFGSVEDFWRALSGEGLLGWQAVISAAKRRPILTTVAAVLLLAALAGLGWKLARPRLPQQKHIAVLPFQNIGNDAANQAFAEGVADSLTSKLSQLERYQKSFWVVPASDTRTVKSLDDAYRNLGVTLAVTGSIEHTPQGINLTANVVDPKNHRQLASRSIRVDSANLDEMQQHVWESVADMLDLQISSQMKEELAAGGTSQPGAYEFYEQGVGYLRRYDVEDVDRAIGLFDKALARDPHYALAYAGLGNAYAGKYALTKDPQWIEKATSNAERAVELNQTLVPARISLGRVYQQTGHLDKALAEYKHALAEDPAIIEAEYRMGEVYQAQGRSAEAEQAYQAAISRRPEYWASYNDLGALYYGNGQFEKALTQFQSVIDLAPDKAIGYYNLGGVYIGMGRYEDAIAVLKKGLRLKPDCNAWTNLGSVYMYVGRYEEAADAMKKATDLSPHNHVLWRNLADSYHQIPSRSAEARWAYEKALETASAQLKVNPNNTDALSGVALYEAHLGQAQDAEKFISQALQLSPKNSDILFTSVLVHEIIGNREKALESVDQAVKAGYSLEEIEKEPELKSLRADPQYQRWLQQQKTRSNETVSNTHQEGAI